MRRVLANGSGDRGSIPGRVIPKTQKLILHSALYSTQHSALEGTYQGLSGAIPGKEYHPSLHFVVVAIRKGAFGSPSINITIYIYTRV